MRNKVIDKIDRIIDIYETQIFNDFYSLMNEIVNYSLLNNENELLKKIKIYTEKQNFDITVILNQMGRNLLKVTGESAPISLTKFLPLTFESSKLLFEDELVNQFINIITKPLALNKRQLNNSIENDGNEYLFSIWSLPWNGVNQLNLQEYLIGFYGMGYFEPISNEYDFVEFFLKHIDLYDYSYKENLIKFCEIWSNNSCENRKYIQMGIDNYIYLKTK